MFEYQNFNSKIDNEHKVILTIIVRRQKSNKPLTSQCYNVYLYLLVWEPFSATMIVFLYFSLNNIILHLRFSFCVCHFSSYSVLFSFSHSFCQEPISNRLLFLFIFIFLFEIRFNIFASIYAIIIFIDSFCVCINISWDRRGRKSNFDKRKKFLWARA